MKQDDAQIPSYENPVPRWLLISYPILIALGLLWLFLFWNGSRGWLDRGYWSELQSAANTKFPSIEHARKQFPD
jgi:hypothetical protein